MQAMRIGYARCSTEKQDLAAQREALGDLGVEPERIYVDHGLTGRNRARPGLAQALAAVREGDDVPGDVAMTLVEWDGASHVTYMIASVFNFITKGLSYIGYQLGAGAPEGGSNREKQLVDAILGIFIDLAEVVIGLGYGALGIVVGTVFNPVDTFFNLAGMVVYSIESAAVGLWNTVADILSLVTLGSAQVQTANW